MLRVPTVIGVFLIAKLVNLVSYALLVVLLECITLALRVAIALTEYKLNANKDILELLREHQPNQMVVQYALLGIFAWVEQIILNSIHVPEVTTVL